MIHTQLSTAQRGWIRLEPFQRNWCQWRKQSQTGSETLFSITLNDTVYPDHVQDGEELWSDRKIMCSSLSHCWGLRQWLPATAKSKLISGARLQLYKGSAFSLRHPTKCLSAGFQLPLDSAQMPSRFLAEVFREQTVFTGTSRRKATVSKLSSHLIWKQAK